METPEEFFDRIMDHTSEDFELRRYKDAVVSILDAYGASVISNTLKEVKKWKN